MRSSNDTIAAISTPAGRGGVAIIRVSGPRALSCVAKIWEGKLLDSMPSHSFAYGLIKNPLSGETVDEVVVLVYRNPASFTGEDVVEISCHGSLWIQREIVRLLLESGARGAEPGEFTKRAFLNGKMDLVQAESVADLISSSSAASHSLAMAQLRGSYSGKFNSLRDRLIEFASLIELELDFSEEEVEFADRSALLSLCDDVKREVDTLINSFRSGNAFKEGIPVVIAGVPNAGKSTLLNHLLGDDKAIVSNIPGTTRDVIEDTLEVGGILFRFIDTAGLREADDEIEKIGVEKAWKKVKEAFVIIWLYDPTQPEDVQIKELERIEASLQPFQTLIKVTTKHDLASSEEEGSLCISAKTGEGIDVLREQLKETGKNIGNPETDIILTNARHHDSLKKASASLSRVKEGLESGLSGDFIAQDLREAISHLSALTGEIATTDLLASIFSRFCIGK